MSLDLLQVLESVDSTNLYLKRLAAEGAADGAAVLAREQTAGRGRLARSFASPRGGGLYLSVLLRPALSVADAPFLTELAALAAAEAVEEAVSERGGSISVGIKWVNDLIAGGRKLAGILSESALTPDGALDYAVVGIGINLRAGMLPAELAEIATTVEDEAEVCLDPIPLARRIADKLRLGARALSEEGGAALIEAYRRRMVLFGKTVTVTRGEERFPARVLDLNGRGELIVSRISDGAREVLSAGEVTLHRETGEQT